MYFAENKCLEQLRHWQPEREEIMLQEWFKKFLSKLNLQADSAWFTVLPEAAHFVFQSEMGEDLIFLAEHLFEPIKDKFDILGNVLKFAFLH